MFSDLVSILSVSIQAMLRNKRPFFLVFFEKSILTRRHKAVRQRLDSDVKFGSLDLINVPKPLTLNSKLIEIFIHLKCYVSLLPASTNLWSLVLYHHLVLTLDIELTLSMMVRSGDLRLLFEQVLVVVWDVKLKFTSTRGQRDEQVHTFLSKDLRVNLWELHFVDVEFIYSKFIRVIRYNTSYSFVGGQVHNITGTNLERIFNLCKLYSLCMQWVKDALKLYKNYVTFRINFKRNCVINGVDIQPVFSCKNCVKLLVMGELFSPFHIGCFDVRVQLNSLESYFEIHELRIIHSPAVQALVVWFHIRFEGTSVTLETFKIRIDLQIKFVRRWQVQEIVGLRLLFSQ